jgi:hypothetical protein
MNEEELNAATIRNIKNKIKEAVEAEREACAKLCDKEADDLAKKQDFFGLTTAENLAEAIRARGQE